MKSDEKQKKEKIKDRLKSGKLADQKCWSFIKELNSRSEERLDSIAMHDGYRKYTYRQMFRAWERYAEAFTAVHLTGKDHARVGLIGAQQTETIFAFYALNMTGASVSLIYHLDLYDEKRIRNMIRMEKITDLVISEVFAFPKTMEHLLRDRKKLGLRNIILLESPMGGEFPIPMLEAVRKMNTLMFREFSGGLLMEDLLREIKSIGNGALGITLCVGEQTKETYQRWYDAGAHRYLLRIESSNPKLYKTLHPQDGHHKWEVRKACLDALAAIGYQVGTGVMIGLPGQTLEDLADDILFYRNQNIAMIGMGPYVVHHNTPLGKKVSEAGLDSPEERARRLRLSINMVAVTRLFLKDVNIAATTAMQTLHPLGREMALKAGANILMPLVTLPQFRNQYQLYDNKPCLEDGQEQCRNCLSARVASVGDTVGWGQWGDSPHFFNNLK